MNLKYSSRKALVSKRIECISNHNYLVPLFQNESKCETFDIKMRSKGLGHAVLGNFSTDQMVIELTKI